MRTKSVKDPKPEALIERDILSRLGFPPGTVVSGKVRGKARKLILEGKPEEAEEYLQAKSHTYGMKQGNKVAMAKSNILFSSTELAETPMASFSRSFQERMFSLSHSNFLEAKTTQLNAESIGQLRSRFGMDIPAGLHQQSVNAVVSYALSVRDGIAVKAINRLIKARHKEVSDRHWGPYHDWCKKDFPSEAEREVRKQKIHIACEDEMDTVETVLKGSPWDHPEVLHETLMLESGTGPLAADPLSSGESLVLRHPPGVNLQMQLSQQTALRLINPQKDANAIALYHEKCPHLPRMDDLPNPTDMIPTGDQLIRRLCPEVLVTNAKYKERKDTERPQKLRFSGKETGHTRGKANKPIFLISYLDTSRKRFIIVDGRGFLHQIRRLFPQYRRKISYGKMVDMFGTDGIVMPQYAKVQLLFKKKSIPKIVYKNPIKGVPKEHPPGRSYVGIDLGVNNLITAVIVNDTANENGHASMMVKGIDYRRIQEKYTKLEEEIQRQAKLEVSKESRDEIISFDATIAQKAKEALLTEYPALLSKDIPWESIGSGTRYISTALGQDKEASRYDSWWVGTSKKLVLKVSEKTRKELNEKAWEIKRNSKGYKRLKTETKELARKIVNDVILWSRKYSPNGDFVFVAEDLSRGSFMDGKGARKGTVGWTEMFLPKKEGRWFKFLGLPGALDEVPRNKGIRLFLVPPSFTSKTCLKCDRAHPDSRVSGREDFRCFFCGFEAHADVVGATNIARVAIRGKKLPGYERSSDSKKPGAARKKKSSDNIKLEIVENANDNRRNVQGEALERKTKRAKKTAA